MGNRIIYFKKGRLHFTPLDNYISRQYQQGSLSPMFFMLFVLQQPLMLAQFTVGTGFLASVLWYKSFPPLTYQAVICFMIASYFVPVFIYLNAVRKAKSDNTPD